MLCVLASLGYSRGLLSAGSQHLAALTHLQPFNVTEHTQPTVINDPLPIGGEYINILHIHADFNVLEGKGNVEVQPEGGQS